MTFRISGKIFKTSDMELYRMIKKASSEKDNEALTILLAAGEAFWRLVEVAE